MTRKEVQARMSDHAGLICEADKVSRALDEARGLNVAIEASGISIARDAEASRAVQWQQMALASEAVLTALDHYIGSGGGSRGARAICDEAGEAMPSARDTALDAFRFRMERDKDKEEQIVVLMRNGRLHVTRRPNRRFDETARSFFERDWPGWLTGRIFDLDGE